jgi:hypothetical protein
MVEKIKTAITTVLLYDNDENDNDGTGFHHPSSKKDHAYNLKVKIA